MIDFLQQLAGGLLAQHGLFLKSLLAALAILFLGLALRRPLMRLIMNALNRLAARREGGMLPMILRSGERPARAMLLVLILYGALSALRLPQASAQQLLSGLCPRVLRIGFILCAAWGLTALASPEAIAAGLFGRSGEKLGETFCRFCSRILRAVIAAFGIVLVLGELGFDPSGFITGLGLGGLTIALAAQDWAQNLFGGLVILFDRPFAVGDWIQVQETIEGVVEDVSLRSTWIRTFDDAQVVTPNSLLVSQPVVNWSRMQKRKLSFDICLSYDSPPERLQACAGRLRSLLTGMPEICEEPQAAVVYAFAESGVQLRVHCFSRLTDFAGYMQTRETLHLQVMQAVLAEGLRFALPAREVRFAEKAPENGQQDEGQQGG